MPPRRLMSAKPTNEVSSYEFMRRFTRDERIAIRTAAKTDPILEDWLLMSGAATGIPLNDADTQAGMDYLVSKGLITRARGHQIITR